MSVTWLLSMFVHSKIRSIELNFKQFFTAGYRFVSATYRLVKLPLDLQPTCQVIYEGNIEGAEEELVIYEGNIEGAEEEFSLDYATSFKVSYLRQYSCSQFIFVQSICRVCCRGHPELFKS
jgi:hypothetical protein